MRQEDKLLEKIQYGVDSLPDAITFPEGLTDASYGKTASRG